MSRKSIYRNFSIVALAIIILSYQACSPEGFRTDGGVGGYSIDQASGTNRENDNPTQGTNEDPVTTTTLAPGSPPDIGTGPNPSPSNGGGLLSVKAQIERAKIRYSQRKPAFISSCEGVIGRATSAINPFKMTDAVANMKFGWCSDTDGLQNSLNDYVNAVTVDMSTAMSAAYRWVLTGDVTYANKAISVLETWSKEATIVDLYDFKIDFAAGSFAGITNDGYCGVRPWNFALDMGWTAYGLRAASEAYILLKNNGFPLTASNHNNIKSLIRRVAATTDSSLDAWNEWARAHQSSSSHNRYISDNHIAQYLSGLAAAAAALGDTALFEYVVNGTAYDFGKGNNRTNYVSLKRYLEEALIVEPNTNRVVFEDYFWKTNYRGYHADVQNALGVLFRTLDLHYPKEAGLYENFKNSKGYSAMMAAETLARYLLGEFEGGVDDNRTGFYHRQVALEFAYSMASNTVRKSIFERALYTTVATGRVPRTQYFREFASSSCVSGEDIRE